MIGLARLALGTGPQREIPAMHLVNFLGLVATFGAYEYFLKTILDVARREPGSTLGGHWARAAAYGLFICIAFTLTPLELTTPDLFAAAAVFAAFGALLRLRDPDGFDSRAALALGVALGFGGLAKSFLIPWGLVCIAVAFAAAWRSRLALMVA